MNWKNVIAATSLVIMLSASSYTLARVGVGVGTGKIFVDEPLNAGSVYKLTPVSVVNTGDEESNYGIGVAYHHEQPELSPPAEWFNFSPQTFTLKPGAAQLVEITLSVPLRVEPGKYFAYVEGFPEKKSGGGETRIGVAAATKLYFDIAPSSFLQGLYYRLLSLYRLNQPWSNRILYATLFIVGVVVFKRYFNIELNTKKTKKKAPEEPKVKEKSEKSTSKKKKQTKKPKVKEDKDKHE